MASLEGELSFTRVPDLLPQADALASASPLSLAAVTRTDSAGLAFLLELSRRARSRGIELRFSEVPAQVGELARFFGLDAVLRLQA